MKSSTIAWILVVVVIIGGWYWASHQNTPYTNTSVSPAGENPTPAPVATTTGAAYVSGNLLLGKDSSASLGTYLIGSSGMTLYRFTKDTPGISNCSGSCATIWPPYTITSESDLKNIQAGIGGTVRAITRADGSMQVTYNGSPLYFYASDKSSEDTFGQGVGGVWFVVKP